MSWSEYVAAHVGGDVNRVVAEKVGVTEPNVSRWRRTDQVPRASHVAAFARAYGRPVLEAFLAAGFLTAEEANAQVVIESEPLDDYDDLELLDELRARHIERVTEDIQREEGENGADSAAATSEPSPGGSPGHLRAVPPPEPASSTGDAGDALAFKHPPEHEWTDEVQADLDDLAAREGDEDNPPDTTTGEHNQDPGGNDPA